MPVKSHYFSFVFFWFIAALIFHLCERTKVGFREKQLWWEELIRLETMAFISHWREQPTVLIRLLSNQNNIQSGVESSTQRNRSTRFFAFPLELLLNQNPERRWPRSSYFYFFLILVCLNLNY